MCTNTLIQILPDGLNNQTKRGLTTAELAYRSRLILYCWCRIYTEQVMMLETVMLKIMPSYWRTEPRKIRKFLNTDLNPVALTMNLICANINSVNCLTIDLNRFFVRDLAILNCKIIVI